MTLSDLIKAAEAGFASVAIDSKREGLEISSGGPDVEGDATLRTEPAALYATEGLACAAWLAEFNRSIEREGNALVWIEKPYVETYRITLGDEYNTFRIVRDRFVVRGTVAVEAAQVDDGIALVSAAHPDPDLPDDLKPTKTPLKIKSKRSKGV